MRHRMMHAKKVAADGFVLLFTGICSFSIFNFLFSIFMARSMTVAAGGFAGLAGTGGGNNYGPSVLPLDLRAVVETAKWRQNIFSINVFQIRG